MASPSKTDADQSSPAIAAGAGAAVAATESTPTAITTIAASTETTSMTAAEIEQHIQRASEFLQENDVNSAVDELVAVVTADPNNVPAQSALGGVLLALQQFELAQTMLYSAVRLSEWKDSVAVINLATVLRQTNDTELSLKVLLKGFNATRDAAGETRKLAAAIGDGYVLLGEYVTAADWYLSAANSYGSDVDLWLKASTLRFPPAAQRLDDAERVLVLAVSKNPTNADLLYWMGRVLYQNNRVQEAIVMYEQALRENNDFNDALLGLATAMHSTARTDDALYYYDIALKRMPNNILLLLNTARLLNGLARQQEALNLINKAYSVDSNSPLVLAAIEELGFQLKK
jgi:tetratricopeptide (TPR) repeat protein